MRMCGERLLMSIGMTSTPPSRMMSRIGGSHVAASGPSFGGDKGLPPRYR